MKQTCLMLLLCLALSTGFAQKIVEKTFSAHANMLIDMDVNISDTINIIAWDKNEVSAKTSVNINNNKDNELYEVTYSRQNDILRINGKFVQPDKDNWLQNINCSINWIVYVPNNAALKIKTINGNITIIGETGSVEAKTISGFVDVTMGTNKGADLELKTITGNIYTDLNLKQNDGNKKFASVVYAKYNGGGNTIALETVSGDLYVRKFTK